MDELASMASVIIEIIHELIPIFLALIILGFLSLKYRIDNIKYNIDYEIRRLKKAIANCEQRKKE